MLNLLFISNSPKVEYVKGALQPLLKVIIDVVTDFDHGLKDVFEKRPATVYIQDQIDGVTGESVARHIQMLLGTSAPKFILLHSGNGKSRAINGLYEHLIDLSQSNDAFVDDIINTLKMVIGDQWEKIYIQPKLTPESVRLSVALPEESREDADKLVDDFLSDLETSGFSALDDQPSITSAPYKVPEEPSLVAPSVITRKTGKAAGSVESDRAQAISDDLAELLIMEADKARRKESSAAVFSAEDTEPGTDLIDSPNSAMAAVKTASPAVSESPSSSVISIVKTPTEKSALSTPEKNNVKTSVPPVTLPLPTQAPVAAEFRISQNRHHAEENIPEDLLLAFEENYRSDSIFLWRNVIIVLIFVICGAGGWYLFTQKPKLVTSLLQSFMPSKKPDQVLVAAPATVPVQQQVPPQAQQPAAADSLPAFIPKDGHDSTYKEKNPGWERYVGKTAEFRIFAASGRIKAVQVLAVNGEPISESLLKSILKEFTGNQEYEITSRSSKSGVLIENGKILNVAELVIYRKNGAVNAFVVSVK